MLTVTDSGCRLHQQHHHTFMGKGAKIIEIIIRNLPKTESGYSYICEHGHSHLITMTKKGPKQVRPQNRQESDQLKKKIK